jgi:hypothetical protein
VHGSPHRVGIYIKGVYTSLTITSFAILPNASHQQTLHLLLEILFSGSLILDYSNGRQRETLVDRKIEGIALNTIVSNGRRK